MKKIILLIMSFLMFISCINVNSLASYNNQTIEPTVFNEDGSYIIITLEDIKLSRSSNTKTGRKTLNYYNTDNELMWTAVLTATFTYTGSSATCTSANITYNVQNSSWQIVSATTSKSGNTATGYITAKHYFAGICIQTLERAASITCSANGTLS